jgi:hypothetical protein
MHSLRVALLTHAEALEGDAEALEAQASSIRVRAGRLRTLAEEAESSQKETTRDPMADQNSATAAIRDALRGVGSMEESELASLLGTSKRVLRERAAKLIPEPLGRVRSGDGRVVYAWIEPSVADGNPTEAPRTPLVISGVGSQAPQRGVPQRLRRDIDAMSTTGLRGRAKQREREYEKQQEAKRQRAK